MNNSRYIHETIIKDIVDVASAVKDVTKIDGFNNKNKSFRSMNQATSNLVLTFPVLVSRNIPIDSAVMISKAIERKATVLMQMLFSAVSLDSADNAIDFVKQYHTNLGNLGVTLDDFMDAMDKYTESTNCVVDKVAYEAIKEDLKNINYTLPDSISESSLNDYKIRNNNYNGNIMVVKCNSNYKPINEDLEKKRDTYDIASSMSKINKDKIDATRNRLLDNDIKKANELVPSTMIIDFISKANKDSSPVSISNVVIGIKAKLYPLESNDIINRIKLKNEDRNGFNKFIKATTREISFWKDLIFAIDKAKIDAISSSSRGSSSKLWKILERRSIKSKLRRGLGQINDASAITTLVISQEEVEYLKKYENIDIEKPMVIRPIMEAYNLMGVCVVDESVEVAKFIFDTGDDNYEVLSYNHLERESNDNTYKKVVNLMTKISR